MDGINHQKWVVHYCYTDINRVMAHTQDNQGTARSTVRDTATPVRLWRGNWFWAWSLMCGDFEDTFQQHCELRKSMASLGHELQMVDFHGFSVPRLSTLWWLNIAMEHHPFIASPVYRCFPIKAAIDSGFLNEFYGFFMAMLKNQMVPLEGHHLWIFELRSGSCRLVGLNR